MAELKRYVVDFEGGGSMVLRLTSEQASEWRKDARVAKVTAAKPLGEKEASPRPRT
jgi:hypothetical protein